MWYDDDKNNITFTMINLSLSLSLPPSPTLCPAHRIIKFHSSTLATTCFLSITHSSHTHTHTLSSWQMHEGHRGNPCSTRQWQADPISNPLALTCLSLPNPYPNPNPNPKSLTLILTLPTKWSVGSTPKSVFCFKLPLSHSQPLTFGVRFLLTRQTKGRL